MIAKTLRKLIPALLVLALVLPCALTVPVSAAESSDEQVYYVGADVTGWTSNIPYNVATKTSNANGAIKHTSFMFEDKTVTLKPFINYDLRSKGISCLELKSPALNLSTDKELELVFRYARFAQKNHDEDINIEWAGGFKVYVSTDGGKTWSDDYATLREHRTLGRGYDGEDMAVVYEAVSTDLSGLVDGDAKINKIKIVPYGPLTGYKGFANILSITVNAYDELPAAPVVEYTEVPQAEVEGVTLSGGDILRKIVVDRIYETVLYPWKADVEVYGYSSNTEDYPNGVPYAANTNYLGPVYSRGPDTSLEMLKSAIRVEDDTNWYTGPVTVKDVYGMDCCGVVGDATSRITGHPTVVWAYLQTGYMGSIKDGYAGSIPGYAGALPETMETDEIITEIEQNGGMDACYAAAQPGDLLLSRKDGSVHARLITKVEGNTIYYSETAGTIGTVTGGQSACRKDVAASYDDLKSTYYVPYTLSEYVVDDQGTAKVVTQQVKIYDAPATGEELLADGLNVMLESNYHLNMVEVKVTDKDTNEPVWSDTVYGELDHYTMEYGDALNCALKTLKPGSYNLTIDVHSGPVTAVGGAVPVTNRLNLNFEVTTEPEFTPLSEISTAEPLSGGKYYLSEDANADYLITITGDVTLCLHGHTLTKTHTGRMFSLTTSGASLTICDCTDRGVLTNTATSGVGVYVGSGCTVNIQGGTITGFKGASSGPIFLAGGSGVMSGGTITGNTATAQGGGVRLNTTGSRFTMTGGIITGNTAPKGGGVSVDGSNRIFTMQGGTISGNNASDSYYGNEVYVAASGTFNMDGGTVSGTGAEATASDCGVRLNGTFTMEGGSITGFNCCPVYMNGGTFNMYGGKITGNTNANGGGVWFVSAGTFNMDGGEISGNTTTGNYGGAVYVGSNVSATITISGGRIDGTASVGKYDGYTDGAAIIARNTGSVTITGGEFVKGVYQDATATGTITVSGGSFTEDPTDYLAQDSGKVVRDHLVNGTNWYEIIPEYALDTTGIAFEEITDLTLSDNTYYLTQDVTIASPLTITGTVTLNLNGFDLSYNDDNYIATLGDGAKLTVKDSTAAPYGELDANKGIQVNSGGEFILDGGAIAGCTGYSVYVNGGTFTMNGGKITGATNYPVYMTGGSFEMCGGKITGNSVKSNGAAVFLDSGSPSFTMTGGEISGNKTNGGGSFGGAVYAMSGISAQITIEGGRIDGTNCVGSKAAYKGGTAIVIRQGNTVSINGGEFVNGVYNGDSDTGITISGGKFSVEPDAAYLDTDHYAWGDDGWFVVSKDARPDYEIYHGGNIIGGATEEDMQYFKLLGNVQVPSTINVTGYATLNLNGCDLIYAGTTANKYAISLSTGDNLTLEDSEEAPNGELRRSSEATVALGGVDVAATGTFTMNGGTITGFNYYPVYMKGGTFTMNGGKITGNSGVGNGAAVFMDSGSPKVTINGGEISGNSTTGTSSYGGTMYTMSNINAQITINGGRIDGTGCVGSKDAYEDGTAIVIRTGNTVNITGGEFVKGVYQGDSVTGTITITGGKFSVEPEDAYVADGCWKEDPDADGFVRVATPYVKSTSVDLGNSLGIKFYLAIDANDKNYTLDDYEFKYSRVYNYAVGDEYAKDDVIGAEAVVEQSDKGPRFYYEGIAAKEMCDEVTFAIYKNDIMLYEFTESLQNYAKKLLNYSESTDADKQAVVDMLVYGAEAQEVFGYNTENLATSKLTEEQLTLATKEDPICNEPGEGVVRPVSSRLKLEDNIVLKLYINKEKAADATTATISYTNHANTEEPGVPVEVTDYNDTLVEVVVDMLAVADARTVVTCTIGDYKCKYSIEANVEATQDNEAFSAIHDLTKAMMKFADSAYDALHPAAES